MRLHSTATYPVTQDTAFAALADFDAMEAIVTDAYGATVLDRSDGAAGGAGRRWRLRIRLRGMERRVAAQIASVTAPERFAMRAEADGIIADMDVGVAAAGEARSAVSFEARVGARSLAGRLLLGPLSLAQPTITPRFHARVQGFAAARLGVSAL